MPKRWTPRRRAFAESTILRRLPPAETVAKSTVRTLYRAQVRRCGDDVVLTVLGDGFLV
ncbi:MAG: hypothetical protein V8Q79_03105 [Christensenellales bacterium]